MRIRTVLPILFTLFALASCKKDKQSGVPLTAVDITINLNLPEYNDLAVVGGWAYITGGSQGLIVYRSGQEEFYAMDRHCTYNTTDLCKVFVDADGIFATDTACCGSSFLIPNAGSVHTGPASIALKQYHTTFNGTSLHIFN